MITERLKTSSATTTSGPVELEEAGEVKNPKKNALNENTNSQNHSTNHKWEELS